MSMIVVPMLVLVAAGAIGFFVWNYRQKAAALEAASAQRMKAFLESARAAVPPASNAQAHPSTQQTAAAPAPPVRQAPPPAQVGGFGARSPLLTPEQRVLYLLLKGGLPDHEVLACVSLAALAQPAADLTGFAREAQQRRLADSVLDFVVCDKSMKGVIAVQCGTRAGKAAEQAAFAAACVAAVGMRWLEISPKALPKRDEIRALVLGDEQRAGVPGAASSARAAGA
ncbi:MAG: DUF2726 domain-containing protein [Betaproteobacteria bacterium]|nr:DUF2726 domain-containing protein [Betaproteobacteria bacterium]